jgi:hypothetical protein
MSLFQNSEKLQFLRNPNSAKEHGFMQDIDLSNQEKKDIIAKNRQLQDVDEVPFLIEIGPMHMATTEYFYDHAAELARNENFHSARLPANLIQAQRDYFGAHTYERVDRPCGQFFHTQWVKATLSGGPFHDLR